jgi:hypothetical protein
MMISAGGAESMMLSDTLSAGTESAESIKLSASPAESMILSAMCLCYYANSRDYKKTPIGDTDNPQSTTLVNSASTALPIGLVKGGRVLPHFKHIVSGVSTPPCPMAAVF